MSQVTMVPLAEDYLITKSTPSYDYSDVFQLKSRTLKKAPIPKDCMVAFFKSFPPVFIKLLIFRETLVKMFGLKTAQETTSKEREKMLNEFKGNIGDHIAIFEVLDKSAIELLTGQTDKHLDFKLSFISYQKNNHAFIELATVVTINNTFGKWYFSIIKPLHCYFVKRILRRMEKHFVSYES